ncbi:MAG: hypothetical protein SF187_11220 [Deltaproteobacteria bacterium]|nr:hypothetical protein [Deltaproteobacteria bacterium]
MKRSLFVVTVLGFAACGGVESGSGLDQPLVLHPASPKLPVPVFKEGPLPGTPPKAVVSDAEPLRITGFEDTSGLGFVGESGRSLAGRASPDAVAVALTLANQGTGYWLLPVAGPDPTSNNELTWKVLLDVTDVAIAGPGKIRVVAIGADGSAGTQTDASFCVGSAVPDNLNSCNPSVAPPAAVISLNWDTAADLDLVVITPTGQVVSPKSPNTAGKGASAEQIAAGGVLDLDAQAGCRFFGRRRENLVFQKPPQPGLYNFYVNVFDGCRASQAHYGLGVYTPQATGPGTSRVVEQQIIRGQVLTATANGGAGKAPGLFVGSFVF